MNPEISRLAARYFYVKQLSIAEKSEIIPFVEKAKTLQDIPEPWRSEMKKLEQ